MIELERRAHAMQMSSRSFCSRLHHQALCLAHNFYSSNCVFRFLFKFSARLDERWKWKRRCAKATHRCVDKWLGNSSRAPLHVYIFLMMYSVQWLIWKKPRQPRWKHIEKQNPRRNRVHIQLQWRNIPRPFFFFFRLRLETSDTNWPSTNTSANSHSELSLPSANRFQLAALDQLFALFSKKLDNRGRRSTLRTVIESLNCPLWCRNYDYPDRSAS